MKSLFPKKKTGLNIIIVGCGKVGVTLVHNLCKEGNDVTVIDKRPEKIQTLTSLYDIMAVTGNGASYSVQMEAGITNADLIIAVTDSDELNLLCCTVASRVGNCSSIARVRTPDYSKESSYLRKRLGLAMIINPELEAAREAARILSLPSTLDVIPFAHGHAEIVKFKIPSESPIANMQIKDIAKDISHDFLICAVERDGNVYIPSGNFTILENDLVSLVGTRKDIIDSFKKFKVSTSRIKNTIIIGGGKVAYYLAKQLLNVGFNVKIIEQDKQRCEELSVLLPKAVIINGDGTDADLLKEEGIETCDSFVPLTGIDEENIMLTLHAKSLSKAKVITKINKISFDKVIGSLDLGSVIYPRFLTSEAIIAYVRALKNSMNCNIETLYHMYDSRVEAIEFTVKEAPDITDIPLMDLKLKDNLLICMINRGGKVFIPSGQDCIKNGDSVMLVTSHEGFKNISDMLR